MADIEARIVHEGDAASSSRLPGPSLDTLTQITKALPPQRVSILMLHSAGRDRAPVARLRQAQFVRRELIARRAHILTLLHTMPEPLALQPAVGQLAGVYWQRLRSLFDGAANQLETEAHEKAFLATQKQALADRADLGRAAEEKMCIDALGAMQRERGLDFWATHPEERLAIDTQLDRVFLARIGLRCLLEHYVGCAEEQPHGRVGVLQSNLSPVELLQHVAAETRSLLAAEHGRAPEITVVGDASKRFTYVPAHIEYVVATLLKNSGVATLRHHHRRAEASGRPSDEAPLPAVKVIVAPSDDALQIKLADEAGGIKRSSLVNVWSYRKLDSKWWRPADGLSLPLARLYCTYFGGSLAFVPMEGFGTDCYITFSRKGSEQFDPLDRADDDVEGGGSVATGLFDVQERRFSSS